MSETTGIEDARGYTDDNNVSHIPNVSEIVSYEFGAMSSRYELKAKNKLTAYATMVYFYGESAGAMVIYEPKTEDSWFNMDGTTLDKLDIIFGGEGSFEKYIPDHIAEIKECYATIKRLV